MPNIRDLREQRAHTVEAMRALSDKPAGDNGDLSTEQADKFDELRADNERIEKAIERQAALDDAERRMSGATVTGPESRDYAQLAERVSIVKAIRGQMQGGADGAELEYSREAERRSGRTAQGLFIPMAKFETRTTTTGNAGELVGTDHMGSQYIGALRNNLVARRMGVRIMSGLQGDVEIPKFKSGTTAGWVAEDSPVPSADMTFGSVTLSPKTAGGMSEMSRNLLLQSSPDIETLVRDDLGFMLAKIIDAAIINGGGTNEPTGVLSASGTQSGSLATPSFQEVLAMIQLGEEANVNPNSWLMSPAAKAVLAGTEKTAQTGEYLLTGGTLAGIGATSTNQVPEAGEGLANVILGDWSQMLLGVWSEADLLVNPYESDAYARGAVKVRVMSTLDTAIRHAEAFIIANDLGTGAV
ncbi:phage major capsid protein [Salinisphaera orenii]|uniref:Major capsid protein HK97 n=1 Tax=Salinisphaera orenii YIM 95161 TaxID=1051139 RepID=A0A423PM77_9GAMM|nr:phage major capsid protein [Salinisphaera halophila]ROO26688.1 major capsid protein HK97 [Salinisphaera halophila YIM 95161]